MWTCIERSGALRLLFTSGTTKYFGGYETCATGIRNFVAAVGIPFYSFDACFSKNLYYKGVYGNLVALVDTKAASLTNVPVALTTELSELESSYSGLFKVIFTERGHRWMAAFKNSCDN